MTLSSLMLSLNKTNVLRFSKDFIVKCSTIQNENLTITSAAQQWHYVQKKETVA